MRSNFYDVQYINNDGTQVQADGPFDWEHGTGSVKITFKITQGAVWASGTTGTYNEHDPKWEKSGHAVGGVFQPGLARAHGIITGTSVPPPGSWPDQDVELAYASQRNVDVDFLPDEVGVGY